MALPITITDAGRAEIINAQHTGTGPVTITEIGFGTGQYTPTKKRTALQAQVKRVSTIAGQAVAADTIHVMAIDESSAAYNVGEFGLFSDKGTLIAVYSQPAASGWIIQKAGPSTLLLATDIILESLNATSITFGDISFINPPATVDTPGVVQLEDSLESTSRSKALTARQGKVVSDELATKAAKATTLSGYGITDAVPVRFSGDWADLSASRFMRSNVNGPSGVGIVGGLQSVITANTFALNIVGRNGRLFWQTLGDADNSWHEVNAWSALTNTPTTLAGYGIPTATQAQAEAGADTNAPMTALRVFQAIAAKVIQATESALGIARIATQLQMNSGTDDATIVTPKKFMASHTYANLAGKPTTLGGYGITDAVPVSMSGDWADSSSSRVMRSGVNGPLGTTIVGGIQSVITAGNISVNIAGRGGRLFWQTLGDADSSWHEINAWSWITGKPTTLAGYGIPTATQAQAEAGADTNAPMTALRVFQAIAAKVIQATESALGIARIATQLQMNSGTDDATIVTPKKLRLGVTYNFGANGYIFLPQWLGGFGIQWVVGPSFTAGSNQIVNFPVPWPNAPYGTWIEQASGSNEVNWSPSALNVNSVTVYCHGPGVGTPRILAIGR